MSRSYGICLKKFNMFIIIFLHNSDKLKQNKGVHTGTISCVCWRGESEEGWGVCAHAQEHVNVLHFTDKNEEKGWYVP